MNRLALIARVAALVVVAAGVGCARVAPYERSKLAHPTMTGRNDDGLGLHHLHAISEGAIGGSDGAGSGCGCN